VSSPLPWEQDVQVTRRCSDVWGMETNFVRYVVFCRENRQVAHWSLRLGKCLVNLLLPAHLKLFTWTNNRFAWTPFVTTCPCS
jgi:hypothetical protein